MQVNYDVLKKYVAYSDTNMNALIVKFPYLQDCLGGRRELSFDEVTAIANEIGVATGLLLLDKTIALNFRNPQEGSTLKKASASYCTERLIDFFSKMGFEEINPKGIFYQKDVFLHLRATPKNFFDPNSKQQACGVEVYDKTRRTAIVHPIKKDETLVVWLNKLGGHVVGHDLYLETFDTMLEEWVNATPFLDKQGKINYNLKRRFASEDLMHAVEKNILHFVDRTTIARTQIGKELEASRMMEIILRNAVASIEKAITHIPVEAQLSTKVIYGLQHMSVNTHGYIANLVESYHLNELDDLERREAVEEIARLCKFCNLKADWVAHQINRTVRPRLNEEEFIALCDNAWTNNH